MFVIVENDHVILGPMPWRPTFFKNCLMDDLEISFNVPLSNDSNATVIVNENVRILPVTDLGPTEPYNSKIRMVNGPFYHFYEDRAEQYWIPLDKPLTLVQGELKNIISANRWKYENAGVKMTLQGQEVIILTNREDRGIYLQALQLSDGSTSRLWKFGNIFLDITPAELQEIVATGAMHIQATFNWESEKFAEIDIATDLDTLDWIELTNPLWEPANNGGL